MHLQSGNDQRYIQSKPVNIKTKLKNKQEIKQIRNKKKILDLKNRNNKRT